MRTDLFRVKIENLKTVKGGSAGEGDIRLTYGGKLGRTRGKLTRRAFFEDLPQIDLDTLESLSLRFMDTHCPGQDKRQLRKDTLRSFLEWKRSKPPKKVQTRTVKTYL